MKVISAQEDGNVKNFNFEKLETNIKNAASKLEVFSNQKASIDKMLEIIDKFITPGYETCQKMEALIKKFFYIGAIIQQAQLVQPLFNELMKKKGEDFKFTI